MLIREKGEVLLAPLYDAAPTLLLNARSSNAGRSVAGQARLNHITLDHPVREGVTWGMDPGEARTAVSEVFMAAGEARVAVSEGLEHLPALIADRVSDLLAGRTARRQRASDGPTSARQVQGVRRFRENPATGKHEVGTPKWACQNPECRHRWW